MEDQLGAPGLALNAVVLFNTLYIDAAVRRLAGSGFTGKMNSSPASWMNSAVAITSHPSRHGGVTPELLLGEYAELSSAEWPPAGSPAPGRRRRTSPAR